MFRQIYVLAWFLLVGAAGASAFRGSLTDLGMVAYGLIALGLLYALVLWSVLNTSEGYAAEDMQRSRGRS